MSIYCLVSCIYKVSVFIKVVNLCQDRSTLHERLIFSLYLQGSSLFLSNIECNSMDVKSKASKLLFFTRKLIYFVLNKQCALNLQVSCLLLVIKDDFTVH